MRKTYELTSPLPMATVMQRMEDLFRLEGVQFTRSDSSITSLKTPFTLGRLDPINYSKRNWVGLNPFTFVSGVGVRCKSDAGGIVKINVEIDRFRAYLSFAFWAACSLPVATAMSGLGFAILFIAGATVAAWFLMVRFFGGFLIKKEIRDFLKLPEA